MKRTATSLVCNWLVFIDLDLHAALRCEFWYKHAVGDLLERCGVGLAAEAIVESVQVSSGDDELEVCGL